MEKNYIKKAFYDYVSSYNANDPKIALKIAHTYRVADLSEKIAESLSLSDEEIMLSWTTGMLHDIARFEQVKRYNTFNDADSIDHAEFGADLLFGHTSFETNNGSASREINEFCTDKLIDRFDIDSKYYNTIETAIRNHNKYRIAEGVNDENPSGFSDLTLCKILRDADKIDILRVNYETPMEEIYNTSREILVNDSISDNVYNEFFKNKAINHALKETMIDRLAGHISLCFELEFSISRQIVLEQGYLEKLLEFKSNNSKTVERLDVMREYILNYLNSEKY